MWLRAPERLWLKSFFLHVGFGVTHIVRFRRVPVRNLGPCVTGRSKLAWQS